MTKPADARATAPVVKFAMLLSRGRFEEEDDDEYVAVPLAAASASPVEGRRLEVATCWRRALRVEK